MVYITERRKHQRCKNLICKVYMSTNRRQWDEVELCDISAGGLKFSSKDVYAVNTHLFLSLDIYNMLSEFNIRVEGYITRAEKYGSRYAYSVAFSNFDKYQQVQLDELIRSRITMHSEEPLAVFEEEIYAFILVPDVERSRKKRIPIYR